MTAKQKAAREKFKKVVAEAGKLRKKNPKLTQAQAVKQAFAMQKKVGAIKIIEKGETKSSKAKAVYQQVRTKKGTFKGLKKVGAVKKKSAPKKAATKRITDIHKDMNSHNVKIKIMSGIEKSIGAMQRQYVAVYDNPNGSSDYEIFKASSLQEAKKFAQFHKRRENIKGKVSVKLIKK